MKCKFMNFVLFFAILMFTQWTMAGNGTQFEATETFVSDLFPPTITFPAGNLHIRNWGMLTRFVAPDFAGNATLVVNVNWDISTFTGPEWGTYTLVVDGGGIWTGTWTGKRSIISPGQWENNIKADLYGSGIGIEGLQMRCTETIHTTEPSPPTFIGYLNCQIFNP